MVQSKDMNPAKNSDPLAPDALKENELNRRVRLAQLMALKGQMKEPLQQAYYRLKNDFNDERFGLFLKRNNLNNKNLVFQEQKHTDHIKLIDKSFLKKRNIIPNNDALITMEKDLYLCAYTADCVPVTLFDPESESVGIIHSGWKGTLNLIVQKTAKMMYESLKINYPDLR